MTAPTQTRKRTQNHGVEVVPGVSRRSVQVVAHPRRSIRRLRWSWRLKRRTVALPTLLHNPLIRPTLGKLVAWTFGVSYALVFLKAAADVLRPDAPPLVVDLEKACSQSGVSCGLVVGVLMPALSLVFATLLFLIYRYGVVARRYRHRAKHESAHLVQTAGSLLGEEIVGRDAMCDVMLADLWKQRRRGRRVNTVTRRPHVIIGGVGAGKTTLLVHLSRRIAARRDVPVPVRLRDASKDLDFLELARERFRRETNADVNSDAEFEKVWRRLLKEDRIVVLADGLEEALNDPDVKDNRDNLVREAVERARLQGLSLVVTSRPHDPLRVLDAAITELEPLSRDDAVAYIRGATPRPREEVRLAWIIDTAEIVESPLYMHLTKELYHNGLLSRVRRPPSGFDSREGDRTTLRVRLLKAWTEALTEGHFREDVPLKTTDRRDTIEHLSALALVGLAHNTLHVRFQDLLGEQPKSDQLQATASPSRPARDTTAPYPQLLQDLKSRLAKGAIDVRLAASRGQQLGVVETSGDGVRFPHSILQAFLGSRMLRQALEDADFSSDSFEARGREFLIALVMLSRAEPGDIMVAWSAQSADGRTPGGRHDAPLVDVRLVLRQLAKEGRALDLDSPNGAAVFDEAALYLYTALLQIDSASAQPMHGELSDELVNRWPQLTVTDDRTMHEVKSEFVQRFADSVRQVSERGSRGGTDDTLVPAYAQFYDLACYEESYATRFAMAGRIGSGGDAAFEALRHRLGVDQESALPDLGTGDGGPQQSGDETPAKKQERLWREEVLRAWLLPQLVARVSTEANYTRARDLLRQWMEPYLNGTSSRHWHMSREIALAQGLVCAANLRANPHHPGRQEARVLMAEQCRDMLRSSRYWYVRLKLLQALTLWSLPDGDSPPVRVGDGDTDARARVKRWLRLEPGEREHPFVDAAGRLATNALISGRPDRFLWIDESAVITRIGSSSTRGVDQRSRLRWIPASTGWSALDRRAQQLVADILLLLQLAERGDPRERDARLQRRLIQSELPPCLSDNRSSLKPMRTVGAAVASGPGETCQAHCLFELCPFPAKGEQHYRAEISETFCRQQQAILSRPLGRLRMAPWQRSSPKALRRFWLQMEQRARQ